MDVHVILSESVLQVVEFDSCRQETYCISEIGLARFWEWRRTPLNRFGGTPRAGTC